MDEQRVAWDFDQQTDVFWTLLLTPPKPDTFSGRVTGMATSFAYVRSTKFAIYRLLERGEFPPRMQLSPRCVGWRVAGVDA